MFLANRFRPIYKTSHLYYDPQNLKQLELYKSLPSGPYNLPIKFIYAKQKPSLFNRFFLDKQLAKRFEYVISFINKCAKNSPKRNRQQFPNIEQTLVSNIESYLKSRPQQIIVHECKVGRAFFIQERKIYGVFYHRKLNLAKSCYSTQFNQKSKQLKYRMKGKLKRFEDIKQFQKAQEMFENEGFSKIYKDTYQGFQHGQFITRSLIKVVADLKVQIKVPQFEQSIRLGYEGPSEHIIQIQSYKVPYQQQQYAITDIDFFLEGNYHFLKEKN